MLLITTTCTPSTILDIRQVVFCFFNLVRVYVVAVRCRFKVIEPWMRSGSEQRASPGVNPRLIDLISFNSSSRDVPLLGERACAMITWKPFSVAVGRGQAGG